MCDQFLSDLKRSQGKTSKYFLILDTLYLASSRGLVVKAEDSWPKGPEFKPPLWRPFSGTIHLDQSLEQKLWKNSYLALLHVL